MSYSPDHHESSSPTARRVGRARWRDPRLWVGVVLVAGSVVVGAQLFDAADDTVDVWAFARDLPPGAPVTAADVETTSVHFGDDASAGSYLTAAEAIPEGATAAVGVEAGQLVATGALDLNGVTASQLPLAVAALDLPADLAPGDFVQVWAVASDDRHRETAETVLDGVAVLAVSGTGSAGTSADRQVLVEIDDPSVLRTALERLAAARLMLVRVGGPA